MAADVLTVHRNSLRTAQLARSAEQDQLRDIVRDWVEKTVPPAEVRRLMSTEDGLDREAWRRLAASQLLPALAIPEEYGGAGFSFAETAVVLEELGRGLALPSFLPTVALAANALLYSGDADACRSWLPGIAAGDLIATVALSPAGVTAARDGPDWVLTGEASFVLDGHIADLILVPADASSGGFFACTADAPGLTRTPLETLDPTRRQARVRWTRTPARLVGAPGSAPAVLDRVRYTAAAALAAEQVGGAARALEMAVEHAKQRHQFGRPIGSFQAIKHTCADLLVRLESARSAAWYAAWAAATSDPSLPVAASVAQAVCSEAFAVIAAENVHLHGGMGFTWEHPAHLYYRRARSSAVLFGDAVEHRSRLGTLLGLSS